MLPEFPKFKPIELSDKQDVEKITHKYPPYSDFNFVSMWSWDIKGEMRLSSLNGNLVVRFTDYLTGEPFYSFLGNNKSTDTVEKLLELSKKEGLKLQLKLIPGDSIKGLDLSKLRAQEDRDHFDYVFSHKNISLYEGSDYQRHRNRVRRFINNRKYEMITLNLADKINQKMLLDLIEYWVNKQKNGISKKHDEDYFKIDDDLENEFIAFKKLLSAPVDFLNSLICFSLFVDGILSGFIVNEKISQDYSLAHFGKANTKYDGIYHFLMQQNSRIFLDLGINYLNHEQDLGLENLRYSKTNYKPTHFLKKYVIDYKLP
jgi:hypothetical protein